MKALGVVVRILILLVAIALFGLALGTMVGEVPFFGSIASYIVLGWYRVFIPAVVAVFLAVVVLFFVKRKWLNLVSAALLVATITLSCVCLAGVIMTFGEEGVKVDVLKSYDAKTSDDIIVTTKVYTTSANGEVSMDIYHIEGQEHCPVIVYIHGGGWISGSKEDHSYYSRMYAEKGYVAISVDYDLSNETQHLAATCEEQLTEALACVATDIGDYGGDADKVYLTGDSAGGNLALELAYKIASGVYVESGGVALPHIKAVAVTYPVAYPAMFWENDDMVLGKYAKNMCEQYAGTTPQEDASLYAEITPSNHIDAFAPPTMIIVGKHDTMVQPEQSYNLYDALQAKGVDSRLVALPYLNHGFDGQDGSVGSQGVLALTLQWFEQHK